MPIKSLYRLKFRAGLIPDSRPVYSALENILLFQSSAHRNLSQSPHQQYHHHRQHQHRYRYHHYRHHGSSPTQLRLLLGSSALGITFVATSAEGSIDESEKLEKNMCETDFDTIRPRHTSQSGSGSRSTLPFSFSTVFLANHPTGQNNPDIEAWDHEIIKATPPVKSHLPPLSRSHHCSIALSHNLKRTKTLRRTRSSHPIGLSICQSRPALPSSTHHYQLVGPPSSSLVSCESSSPVDDDEPPHRSLTPNHPQRGRSTNPSTPLRNSRSLHFVKHLQRGSRQVSHSNSIHACSVTPSSSPCPNNENDDNSNSNSSHRPVSVSSASSRLLPTVLPAAHESTAAVLCPKPFPFPSESLASSPPTSFSGFVKAKIQKTARSSNSNSRTSSSASFQSLPAIPPPPLATTTVPVPSSCGPSLPPSVTRQPNIQPQSSSSHPNYRSLSFSATYKVSNPLSVNHTPPISMPAVDLEVEALLDQRGGSGQPLSSLRSSPSQPFMRENPRRLNGLRSQSILAESFIHKRSHSFTSAPKSLQQQPPSYKSGFPGSQRLSKLPLSSNSRNSSPPRNTVRTHLTRLANLLTPSPNLKNGSTGSSKGKTPSPPLQSKAYSISQPRYSELDHRSGSATTLGVSLVSGSTHGSISGPMEIINWRTTITDREYQKILEKWGTTEIHRQQLIWELCQTEIAFLDSLTLVSDLFTSPLKFGGPQGSWVAEVPEDVQILLGDLDQITNLHSEIVMGMSYNRLCEKKRNKAPIVIKFAEVMAAFVPRLRIYERYLVRFERVSQLIDRLSLDPGNSFGSFVRIQSHAAGFGAMTLTSYLLKPIQRLMKYPLFFKQLCDTTPVGHPDHSPISNLWSATDGIIRSMQDVKGLEDDHEVLKTVEEQLLGLPEGIVLANRRRRIIARGTFLRIYPGSKDLVKLSLTSGNRLSLTSHSSSRSLNSDYNNKAARRRMPRPLSPVSDTSEMSEYTHSQMSIHSTNTESSLDLSSSPAPLLPPAPLLSSSSSSCSHQVTTESMSIEHETSSARFKAPRSLHTKRSSHKLTKGRSMSSDLIEVFLLSDMVLLCIRETFPKKNWRSSSKKSEEYNRLRVLNNIGLSRLTYVEDVGGKLGDFDELVRLDLTPLEEFGRKVIKRKDSLTDLNLANMHSDNHVIYLSSLNPPSSTTTPENKKLTNSSSNGCSNSHYNSGSLGVTTGNCGVPGTMEKDWRNWLNEFKSLEMSTNHHIHRRHHDYKELKKRRRSNNGKIDFSIKKASSMQNLS